MKKVETHNVAQKFIEAFIYEDSKGNEVACERIEISLVDGKFEHFLKDNNYLVLDQSTTDHNNEYSERFVPIPYDIFISDYLSKKHIEEFINGTKRFSNHLKHWLS